MEVVNKRWFNRMLTSDGDDDEGGTALPPPPQLSSIPSMLWAQAYHQLQPLVELKMGTGVCRVIQWSHKYFAEFAESRYLSSEDQVKAIYESLADYFSGKYVLSQGISLMAAINMFSIE